MGANVLMTNFLKPFSPLSLLEHSSLPAFVPFDVYDTGKSNKSFQPSEDHEWSTVLLSDLASLGTEWLLCGMWVTLWLEKI